MASSSSTPITRWSWRTTPPSPSATCRRARTSLIVPFLLTFGGAELYLAKDPKGRSRLEALVGYEKAAELATKASGLKTRIPLAKPFLAAALAWQGEPVAEIARRLHATDTSVRKWLREAGVR